MALSDDHLYNVVSSKSSKLFMGCVSVDIAPRYECVSEACVCHVHVMD